MLDGLRRWFTEREEIKSTGRIAMRDARLRIDDPYLAQLYERHASTVCTHVRNATMLTHILHPDTLTLHLDGGTTLFVPKEEWPDIRTRIDLAFASGEGDY